MELDTFNECVQEAIQENQEQGKRRIAKFEEKHLLVGSALPVLSLPPAPEADPTPEAWPRCWGYAPPPSDDP